MKKAINNKMYDTATARPAGRWTNGLYPNDFEYCAETLYCKKTGEYFLHGEGGGNSRYGEWHGNSGGPGEKIMPLGIEDARKWAEKHLDGEDYVKEFGEPEEGEDRVPLSLTVSTQTKARLEAARQQTGQSMSKLVDAIVAAWDGSL